MHKILLVEDNEMNRDMLSRRLERKGYQVVLAVDGQTGFEMAKSEAPDLVLMDMSLPVLRNAAYSCHSAYRARDVQRQRKGYGSRVRRL
jgi:CheY-like chemotaxis protein